MRLRTFLKPLSFLPAIFLMYMIFSFSAQEADVSSSLSYKASTYIIRGADYVFDLQLEDWQISDYAVRIDKITRKLAHMTEYFLLAIAVSFPLYVYGLHGILLVLLAGAFCVAFAVGDEYHQTMVAGRAGQLKDVYIDSFGILIGIILVRIIGWTGRMTIFRPDQGEPDRRAEKKERRRRKREMQEAADRERERQAKHARVKERPAPPPVQAPKAPDPQEEPEEDDWEDGSSDELSEDMPFSRLFRPRR